MFGRKPSDPVPPAVAAQAGGDLKGSDDLPLPDDIRLGENVLRFNKGAGAWQLSTKCSATDATSDALAPSAAHILSPPFVAIAWWW